MLVGLHPDAEIGNRPPVDATASTMVDAGSRPGDAGWRRPADAARHRIL